MKHSRKLLTGIIAASALAAVTFVAMPLNQKAGARLTEDYSNCEYLWDNYSSMASINKSGYTNSTSTWGTVTQVTYDETNEWTKVAFNNKSRAGICAGGILKIDNCFEKPDIKVGDFLLVSGKPVKDDFSIYTFNYDNSSSKNTTVYEIKRDVPTYEVETIDLLSILEEHQFENFQSVLVPYSGARIEITGELNGSLGGNYYEILESIYKNHICAYMEFSLGSSELHQTKVMDFIDECMRSEENVTANGYLSVASYGIDLICLDTTNFKKANSIPVNEIEIIENEVTVEVDGSYYVDATVKPVGADLSLIEYSVENPSICSFDKMKVTGLSEGQTEITVSCPSIEYTKTIHVTVNPKPAQPESIEFDKYSYACEVDSFVSLNACVKPDNAPQDVVYQLSFFSDDSIGFVEGNKFYGVKAGQVTIEAYALDYSYIYKSILLEVFDSPVKPTKITIDSTAVELEKGNTTRLSYNLTPSNATDNVYWTSSNPDVATVDFLGYVTGIAPGTATIIVTSGFDSSITAICTVTITKPVAGFTLDLSSLKIGSYVTNFGTTTAQTNEGDRISIGLYRYGTNGVLYPSSNLTSALDFSLPGSIYNSDACPDISSITVTYKGTGTIGFGKNKDFTETSALTKSSTFTTKEFKPTSTANYFKVEAKNEVLTVKSIKVNYDTSKSYYGNTTSLTHDYRGEATVYSGELIDGVSSVYVPTYVQVQGSEYVVNGSKKLTYYSWDYVQSNYGSLNLDEVAITDPLDVAAYYVAFHSIPANFYLLKNDTSYDVQSNSAVCTYKSNVSSIFGSMTRAVQQYNKLTGYAQYVPYRNDTHIYLEFDIDMDGTYQSNRGSNRVVIWTDGWTNTNGVPAAVFTDDHYATFREYNYIGGWNSPFDAQTNTIITNKEYGNPTLIYEE